MYNFSFSKRRPFYLLFVLFLFALLAKMMWMSGDSTDIVTEPIEEYPVVEITAKDEEVKNGIPFRETFQKGDINCTSTYTITGTLPIKVKRTYRSKDRSTRTEYLILKEIGLEHAQEIYQLVSNSREHLGRFLPDLLTSYGISEEIARSHLKELILFNRMGVAFKLGIFYQAYPGAPLKLIGMMGAHSPSYYQKYSWDVVYWIGDFKYIGVKGVVTILEKALINFLVFTTPASRFNAVMLKSNKVSKNIAEKIGMRPVKYPFIKYRKWGYREKKEDVFVYTISKKEWIKKHWGHLELD